MNSNHRNTNIRLGLSVILTFLMLMCVASWIATQYFAAVLAYHPGLGSPAWSIGKMKIYQPFAWWFWNLQWMHADGILGSLITRTQFIVVAGAFVSVCCGIWMYYRRSMQSELPEDLHGTARWATLKDIQKMKLISHEAREGRWFNRRRVKFKARGVYLGAFDTPEGRMALRYDEPAHVLCFAPSRSGKGVGPVLTTLLSYPHSTLTNDIKGENFELSSGFRHTAGTLAIRFDPTALDQKSIDGKTRFNVAASWNVLEEIRAYTEYDEMDAQNIAAAIADPDGKGMEDHWVSTSYDLLQGVILHVLYYEREKSLAGVANYLSDPSFTEPEQMFNRMLEAEHDPDGKMGWIDSAGRPTKTHPAVAREARAMLNKEEKERNSVLSTAKTKLTLYAEPIVARNIARSDFRISDLMNHVKPVSLYMVVPPSDKERLRPLIRLFLTFMLRRLTKDMSFEDGQGVKGYRHRLLLLIDELASLKKLEQLQDGLSYIAGYGITAFLFVQDTIQLREAYGDNETITAGCQLRLAFAPNTLDTAEDLSKMTGISTRRRQNVSYSGSRMTVMLGQMSVSEELIERPLLTTDEVMRLPRDEALIFNTGYPPIRAKKLRYFEMPEFLERARTASPSRVAISYRDSERRAQSAWFMVLCSRRFGTKSELDVVLNCYAEFPAVRVIVKQEDLVVEKVCEYEFDLLDPSGEIVDRPLTVDDRVFRIRQRGQPASLNLDEAFEVHFVVKNPELFQDLSQKGFFRETAVCEKELRREVKAHYRVRGQQEAGKPTEVTIDKITDGGRYSGTIVMETDDFVVLEGNSELVSLHRKGKLDRVPRIGEHATITYLGRKGRVL